VRYDTRNPNGYFNPSPFVLPPGYSNSAQLGGSFIGNAGRDTLQAPGIAKFDIVITKSTPITERISLQFRSEFFNLLNRANLGLPSGRIFATAGTATTPPVISSTVGQINDTTTISRQIQFGLRLTF